jgi:ribosomal-protein-alanine N-acetyltransferase
MLEPAARRDASQLANMSARLVEQGLRPSWDAARIAQHTAHPESMVLVARNGFHITGFAIMRYGDQRAHLNLLAVEPSWRRRGIGRALLRWLEETAVTAGVFHIDLELRSANASAYAFYAALGYREVGRVPAYYQGVEHAVRMSRDLAVARCAPL